MEIRECHYLPIEHVTSQLETQIEKGLTQVEAEKRVDSTSKCTMESLTEHLMGRLVVETLFRSVIQLFDDYYNIFFGDGSNWHRGSSPRLAFAIVEETITRMEKRDKSTKKTIFLVQSFLGTG